jgi:hypothetical protein
LSDRVEISWAPVAPNVLYEVLLDNGIDGYVTLDEVSSTRFIAMTGENA